MLKFLGKKRKRQLLRSLSSDPLSERRPVYGDNVLRDVLIHRVFQGAAQRGGAILLHSCVSLDPFFVQQRVSMF